MESISPLAQIAVLVCIVLIIGFVVMLALPHGKIRKGTYALIGCGCVICSIAYLLDPCDIMPDTVVDDLFALVGGMAAAVAAMDAGRPDDPTWCL